MKRRGPLRYGTDYVNNGWRPVDVDNSIWSVRQVGLEPSQNDTAKTILTLQTKQQQVARDPRCRKRPSDQGKIANTVGLACAYYVVVGSGYQYQCTLCVCVCADASISERFSTHSSWRLYRCCTTSYAVVALTRRRYVTCGTVRTWDRR